MMRITYWTVDDECKTVEITRLRVDTPNRFSIHCYSDGIGVRDGTGERLFPWEELTDSQIRHLILAGLPTPCQFGVVVDGWLAETLSDEGAAKDRVTEHRAHGCIVELIKLPVGQG